VNLREPLDDRLVVEAGRRPSCRHGARERVPGDVLDGAHLAAGEPGPAQPRGACRRDVRRRRKAAVVEERDEAREDRLRGAAVELLVGDGAGERFVGRPPPRRKGARAVAPDEPAHHRIAREVTVRGRRDEAGGRHRDRIQRR